MVKCFAVARELTTGDGDFGAFAVGTTKPVSSARGPINASGLHLKFDGTHIYNRGCRNSQLTVTHPLGGCPIAPSNLDGVVNEFGEVFDGSKPRSSSDVYPGLYVVD